MRESLDNLKVFQEKGSFGYIDGMRSKLIDIAFYLTPAVDELMQHEIESEEQKYRQEHIDLNAFYNQVVEAEKAKFDVLYQTWKASVVKFHQLKQDHAIKVFVEKMNSKRFVNPDTRVQIFRKMKEEQQRLFNLRFGLVKELSGTHPRDLTKEIVNAVADKLSTHNEESSIMFDNLVQDITKDMENTNEDIDIALYDLKDFIVKNDAELEPGITFDTIMEKKA